MLSDLRRNGPNKKQTRSSSTNAAAMSGLVDSVNNMNSTMKDMANERRLGRLQTAAAGHVGAASDGNTAAAPPSLPSPTTRKHDVIAHLEALEMYLDVDDMVTIIDLFSKEVNSADTYMAMTGSAVRKGWIMKRLTELGRGQTAADAQAITNNQEITDNVEIVDDGDSADDV